MSDERNERNAIFGQQHAQQNQNVAQVKTSLGVETPVEVVPMPSLGKLYSAESSLGDRTTLDIRPMTTREEDILTNRALIKKGTVITELIKSCLSDKSVNVAELVAGDRNALMVAVRITGYGAEYKGDLTCTECSAKFDHEFDLAQLPIKVLDIEPVRQGTNEFAFTLPMSKRNVTFKFLTGKDEEDISARQETLKKKQLHGHENLVTTKLQYSIISVDGVTDRNQITQFISNMPARDSLALRSYIDKHEPGIEMKQNATCPSCGHAEEVGVPMGVSFFWPNAG